MKLYIIEIGDLCFWHKVWYQGKLLCHFSCIYRTYIQKYRPYIDCLLFVELNSIILGHPWSSLLKGKKEAIVNTRNRYFTQIIKSISRGASIIRYEFNVWLKKMVYMWFSALSPLRLWWFQWCWLGHVTNILYLSINRCRQHRYS